jgi:hypothetical protein
MHPAVSVQDRVVGCREHGNIMLHSTSAKQNVVQSSAFKHSLVLYHAEFGACNPALHLSFAYISQSSFLILDLQEMAIGRI